jgi:hypothetical protein
LEQNPLDDCSEIDDVVVIGMVMMPTDEGYIRVLLIAPSTAI